MEIEEEHDELVTEVVKRLEKNNLYVKPEKCKWKVREVEFLGVVIGPEGIKMEKEKVKEVLEWPTPKCVKDVQKFLGLANYYRCYESRLKVFKSRNNSCIGVTQENSIEFLIQSSLPYILLLMVCARYCASYPK